MPCNRARNPGIGPRWRNRLRLAGASVLAVGLGVAAAGQILEAELKRIGPPPLAMAEDLERYAEGRSIQSRPPSVASRVARLVARHRGPAAAIGTHGRPQ